MTVVKPGLPTVADLYVLLPPPRPTRKRSLWSDKVCPTAKGCPVVLSGHRLVTQWPAGVPSECISEGLLPCHVASDSLWLHLLEVT